MPYQSRSFNNPFGFTLTPWVKRLLIANTVLFLITLAFSALGMYLAFTPARILTQPWTPVTYMFVHASLGHLFFNMLGLFFFGPPLEERWGGPAFLKFYLIAGLGGAAGSLAFPHSPVVGASGAIFGVLVAFAMIWPDNPIYIWGIFPVKAKWLVTGYIVLNLLSLSGGPSGVAYLAHLGGALAAFIYLKSPMAPRAWGGVPAPRKQRTWDSLVKRRPKAERAAPAKKVIPAARDRDEARALDDVDRILDKISNSGLSSLTEEERRRLDEASRRFRSN